MKARLRAVAAAAIAAACACYDPYPDETGTGGAPQVVTAIFAPTDEEWGNPERGFYYHVGSLVESGAVFGNDDPAFRLVYAPTILGAFVDGDISDSALENLDDNLTQLRTLGKKAILMFAYSRYDEAMPAVDLARVEGHAQQLAPVLEANKDAIAYVLGGFVGSGGSWSGSVLTSVADKTGVRDAVLSMVPVEIPIQLLDVPIVQEQWYATPLTAQQALARGAQARIGFNNPCMLASNDDFEFVPGEGETYPGFTTMRTQIERRAYLASVTSYAPFGGETCVSAEEPRRSEARMKCEGGVDGAGQPGGIRLEGPRYHMTYINPGHTEAFADTWRDEGCFDEVARSLGYRFQLDAVRHPRTARRGAHVLVEIDLRNVGWGRIFSARPLVVTLLDGKTAIVASTSADLRTLPPQAAVSTTLVADVDVAATVPPGEYTVLLSAPDVYPEGEDPALTAVRFANADQVDRLQVWDTERGRITTGTTITIE